MDLRMISAGQEPPKDLHAVIEIPLGGVPVKYEMDKASGALFVDRFLHTAMFYPGQLRLHPAHAVPRRRSLRHPRGHSSAGRAGRGDPLPSGRRPDHGRRSRQRREDHRRPGRRLHPFYTGVRSYRDLPSIMCDQIAHFFQHYKDLEKGKWVSITNWLDAEPAEQIVMDAIARAQAAA